MKLKKLQEKVKQQQERVGEKVFALLCHSIKAFCTFPFPFPVFVFLDASWLAFDLSYGIQTRLLLVLKNGRLMSFGATFMLLLLILRR